METEKGETLEQTLWREMRCGVERFAGWTWGAEESDYAWQLFAMAPASDVTYVDDDGTERQITVPTLASSHGLQVIKAPKVGTPYAEYWPDQDQQRYLLAALNGLPLALERIAELERERQKVREIVETERKIIASLTIIDDMEKMSRMQHCDCILEALDRLFARDAATQPGEDQP